MSTATDIKSVQHEKKVTQLDDCYARMNAQFEDNHDENIGVKKNVQQQAKRIKEFIMWKKKRTSMI